VAVAETPSSATATATGVEGETLVLYENIVNRILNCKEKESIIR
jgi:hypothetical protein